MATFYARLADMWLAAGEPAKAAAALDRAVYFMETYGQRNAEGFSLLERARLLHAVGEPRDVVRAAAERARSLATEREGHMVARLAQKLLDELI